MTTTTQPGAWKSANNGAGVRNWFVFRPRDTNNPGGLIDEHNSSTTGQLLRYGSWEAANKVADRLNRLDNEPEPCRVWVMSNTEIRVGTKVVDYSFASRYGVDAATIYTVTKVIGDQVEVYYTESGQVLMDTFWTDEMTTLTISNEL